MALISMSAMLVPLSAVFIARGPSMITVWSSIVSVLFIALVSVSWLMRWPTRWQSEIAAVAGTVVIAGWSVGQSSPAMAMLTCSAFALTGGYLAFFHSIRSLTVNAVIALATTVWAGWRLGASTDAATAVTAFWLTGFLNVSVPVTVGSLARAVGRYADRADEDDLTGLLNRRGFAREVERVLCESLKSRQRTWPNMRLAVLLLDIDSFKQINDTLGHPAGDRVIIGVAQILRQHAPLPAVLCRAGGEEFLIAVLTGSDVLAMAQRICRAVAGLPEGITASIGIATADRSALGAVQAPEVIARLVAEADTAMFMAKANGGNGIRSALADCASD